MSWSWTVVIAAVLAAALTVWAIHRRTSRRRRDVDWRIDQSETWYVLVCVSGVVREVKIDLRDNDSPHPWGQLKHRKLRTGDTVRIGRRASGDPDEPQDEVTVTWKVGRRLYTWSSELS